MTPEEQLHQLKQENRLLRERERLPQAQLAQQDGLIAQLQQQVQALQERLSKNSHNSHLPPSSDRFLRQPKRLRNKSEKKAGGSQIIGAKHCCARRVRMR